MAKYNQLLRIEEELDDAARYAGGRPSRGTAADEADDHREPDEPARSGEPRMANLTGRAAMLALVVCLLAISLAYPLRVYLSQRGDIADYRAPVAAQEQQVAALAAPAPSGGTTRRTSRRRRGNGCSS